MRTSGRVRRAFALTASAVLAATLAGVPAGPASANVSNHFLAAADGSSDFTGTGGFSCPLTAGVDNPESSQATFSAGTKTRAVNLNQTFTSTANSSDVTTVTGSYKGSLSVAKHRGDLATFAMSGSGHATISRALGHGTQCQTHAFLGIESTTTFTESRPGWLYITRDTGKSAETVFIAEDGPTGDPVLFEIYVGNQSKATARGFLAPGTYVIPEWIVGIIVGQGGVLKSAGGGTLERDDLSSQMTGKFYRAGAAYGATHGKGRSFVRFPGAISCSRRSAKLTFTGKAGEVAGASFAVNGHQAATVSNPKAGHSVVLRHLGRTVDNKISATLSLNGAGSVSATRAYVPCKG